MTGDHWTLKCPYKNLPPDQIPDIKDIPMGDDESGQKDGNLKGKYVPPARRSGAEGESAPSGQYADRDSATLRVTNISSETRESDLQELFRPFGPIARIYLVSALLPYCLSRGRVTGSCRQKIVIHCSLEASPSSASTIGRMLKELYKNLKDLVTTI